MYINVTSINLLLNKIIENRYHKIWRKKGKKAVVDNYLIRQTERDDTSSCVTINYLFLYKQKEPVTEPAPQGD